MLREQTAASRERRTAALAGLRAYQQALRGPPPQPMTAIDRRGTARLYDYGGIGRAVIFVPSLINPALILDLSPATSLLRWLAREGAHPYLLDWGTPQPADAALDITGHVERILLPLIAGLAEPPVLVGYCLGGTMALAAAASMHVAGCVAIATPWHFEGFGDAARADLAMLWEAARPGCEAMGLVPAEVLQAGFWRLDPARIIAKYEAFGALDPASDAARTFVAMEDWANSGAALTLAAGRQLFEEFIGGDRTGRGGWSVGGRVVDPQALPCPTLEFVSTTDRIVPRASAAGLADRRDLALGHVGMIVGSRARAALWEPLAAWLRAQ
ncbi:alpha/beta fold hydrolase [uncultured Sphingomonas sp.]|uniref:alpha/beta fold hydrolase n=1 Tax=uncultured Sphingomonas sp. TaxID=158754 RepID=UPI0035CC4E66